MNRPVHLPGPRIEKYTVCAVLPDQAVRYVRDVALPGSKGSYHAEVVLVAPSLRRWAVKVPVGLTRPPDIADGLRLFGPLVDNERLEIHDDAPRFGLSVDIGDAAGQG